MSEPACVPPEAAASVDDLLAMWQELSRAKDSIWKLEGLLKSQMTKEPPHAAFDSYEAPMPDERAGAQLTPQDLTCYAAGLD
jgi:hypothetical protein